MDLKAYFAKRGEELAKSVTFHKAMAGHHADVSTEHTAHAAVCKAQAAALGEGHEMEAHMHKSAAHHTALAAHHDAMSKAHHAMADCMKADEDSMKAVVTDLNKTAAPAAPAAPAAAPAPAKGTPMKPEDIKKCAAVLGMSEEDFAKKYPLVVDTPQPTAAPTTTPGGIPITGVGLDEKLKIVTETLVQKALEALDKDPKVAEAVSATVLARVGEALGKKIVPDSVSSIPSGDTPGFGIRAVPRPGAPSGPSTVDKAAVPPEFQHLVQFDDEV